MFQQKQTEQQEGYRQLQECRKWDDPVLRTHFSDMNALLFISNEQATYGSQELNKELEILNHRNCCFLIAHLDVEISSYCVWAEYVEGYFLRSFLFYELLQSSHCIRSISFTPVIFVDHYVPKICLSYSHVPYLKSDGTYSFFIIHDVHQVMPRRVYSVWKEFLRVFFGLLIWNPFFNQASAVHIPFPWTHRILPVCRKFILAHGSKI